MNEYAQQPLQVIKIYTSKKFSFLKTEYILCVNINEYAQQPLQVIKIYTSKKFSLLKTEYIQNLKTPSKLNEYSGLEINLAIINNF